MTRDEALYSVPIETGSQCYHELGIGNLFQDSIRCRKLKRQMLTNLVATTARKKCYERAVHVETQLAPRLVLRCLGSLRFQSVD